MAVVANYGSLAESSPQPVFLVHVLRIVTFLKGCKHPPKQRITYNRDAQNLRYLQSSPFQNKHGTPDPRVLVVLMECKICGRDIAEDIFRDS